MAEGRFDVILIGWGQGGPMLGDVLPQAGLLTFLNLHSSFPDTLKVIPPSPGCGPGAMQCATALRARPGGQVRGGVGAVEAFAMGHSRSTDERGRGAPKEGGP